MGYLFVLLVLTFKLLITFKKINMKNAFKFGFLALVISLAVACKGKESSSEDSTATDTTVVDSPAVDTAVVDTAAADTTKM